MICTIFVSALAPKPCYTVICQEILYHHHHQALHTDCYGDKNQTHQLLQKGALCVKIVHFCLFAIGCQGPIVFSFYWHFDKSMDLQSLFRIPVKLQLIFLYCFGGKHFINNCKFTFDTTSYEEHLELLVYNFIKQKEL